MMRYFWRLYYAFRPVRSHKLSEFLRSTARMQGVRLVEHRLVNRPRDTVDYRGLGWVEKGKTKGGEH